MLSGCIDVSKESITWCLNQPKKGNAVVIVVGGAQEALDAHPGHYNLTIKRRKGFVKLAIRNGAHLVPIFSFGENDLYYQIDNPEGSKLRKFQDWLKGMLGFSSPAFRGRGIFNYSLGILPFRKPINTVVGAPIPVEKCEEPTTDQINHYHQKYLEGLTTIFEDNKKKFGLEDDAHLNFV